jgi:hypothetical protein
MTRLYLAARFRRRFPNRREHRFFYRPDLPAVSWIITFLYLIFVATVSDAFGRWFFDEPVTNYLVIRRPGLLFGSAFLLSIVFWNLDRLLYRLMHDGSEEGMR